MSPLIEPVDRSEAGERRLAAAYEESDSIGVPGDRFLGILAHVPKYATAIHDAMYESHARGNVDHRLKEIIRVHLARLAGDSYFAGLRSTQASDAGLTEEMIEAGGDFENDPRFTDAEKWALRYAATLYRRPEEVDRGFYAEGKKHYSEAQIMELGGMIAIHYGMQRFMATLVPTTEEAGEFPWSEDGAP